MPYFAHLDTIAIESSINLLLSREAHKHLNTVESRLSITTVVELELGLPAVGKMLQNIRNSTTRLVIIKPSIPSQWLLKTFSTNATLSRAFDSRYPDEDARKAAYKCQAECHKTRYHNNPVYRAKQIAQARSRHHRHKNDAHRSLYVTLSDWSRRYEWVRDDLPWKTHVPLWHKSSVEHYCYGCDWTRSGGARLWWRKRNAGNSDSAESEGSLDKSDEYLCLKCYVSSRTRFEALPEGYEDVENIKDVVARKRQLGGLAASSSDTSNR